MASAAPPIDWHALQYFTRFGRYISPFRGILLLGVGFRIAEMAADLSQPWPLAIIVDSVLGHHPLGGPLGVVLRPFDVSPLHLLTAAVLASVVFAVASAACDYTGDRVMNGAGERITASIRSELFGHLQRLPLAYHDRHAIGETVSRASVDTSRIEDALVDIFSTLLPGILNMVGLLVVIFAVRWQLGLVAITGAPLVLVTVYRYTRLTRAAARTVRQREGRLAAYVTETLSGIGAVQVFGNHELHDARYAALNAETLSGGLRSVDLRARFTPMIELCVAAGTGLLLWVGAWGVLNNLWTVGILLVVAAYVRSMLKPIRSLSKLSLTLSRGAASAERVAAVLDEPLSRHAEIHAAGSLPPRARGKIELVEVTFGYKRERVLHDATLTIESNEKVALIGANGTGKSSTLALIARLYDPESGSVRLDGVALEDLPAAWFRAQVSVVLQETFLFSGTLWDNIAYGRPGASDSEIRSAAEHARVSDFVRSLPDGFDTVLGDRGVGLSGGQQQRVAIARALLRDAPIVLLDEPTSGLDLAAEAEVVGALRELMRDRTVVMATHRPALLALADRTLRVERGKLVPVYLGQDDLEVVGRLGA